MLRRWKRQVEQDGDQAFPGHGRLKADDEQLRQLLRENQRLREEREILVKAVAIFSDRRR
jgi:transposase